MRKIVTVGFGVLAALALGCSAGTTTGADADQPSSAVPAGGSGPDAAPNPPPAPKEPPADQALKGRGDKILQINLDPDFLHIATITHTGRSNFIVRSIDASGDTVDLLVNEIGKYRGTRPLDLDEKPAALRIEADGAWTVTIRAAQKAPVWTGSSSGTGAAVLLVHPDALGSGLGTVKITHNGKSNFIVKAYGDRNDLLVNEIGDYSGETIVPRGTVLLEIDADGDWTIRKL